MVAANTFGMRGGGAGARLAAESRLADLRQKLREAIAQKNARMKEFVESCKADRRAVRDHVREMRVRSLRDLADQIKAARGAAKLTRLTRLAEVRQVAGAAVERARAAAAVERQHQAELARIDREERSRRIEIRLAHERAVGAGALRSSVFGKLAPLFEREGRGVRQAPGESRAEALLRFAERNPEKAHAVLEPTGHRKVEEIQRAVTAAERSVRVAGGDVRAGSRRPTSGGSATRRADRGGLAIVPTPLANEPAREAGVRYGVHWTDANGRTGWALRSGDGSPAWTGSHDEADDRARKLTATSTQRTRYEARVHVGELPPSPASTLPAPLLGGPASSAAPALASGPKAVAPKKAKAKRGPRKPSAPKPPPPPKVPNAAKGPERKKPSTKPPAKVPNAAKGPKPKKASKTPAPKPTPERRKGQVPRSGGGIALGDLLRERAEIAAEKGKGARGKRAKKVATKTPSPTASVPPAPMAILASAVPCPPVANANAVPGAKPVLVTSALVDSVKPFKVRASCGHIEVRKMREATAGVPYSESVILNAPRGRACEACEAKQKWAESLTPKKDVKAPDLKDTAEIASRIRADIAEAVRKKGLPKGKYSVKTSKYSMGSSIDVVASQLPFPVLNPAAFHLEKGSRDVSFNRDKFRSRYTPEAERVLTALNAIVDAYHWDRSDSASDYYHERFARDVKLDDNGEWKRINEEKVAAARAATPGGKQP